MVEESFDEPQAIADRVDAVETTQATGGRSGLAELDDLAAVVACSLMAQRRHTALVLTNTVDARDLVFHSFRDRLRPRFPPAVNACIDSYKGGRLATLSWWSC